VLVGAGVTGALLARSHNSATVAAGSGDRSAGTSPSTGAAESDEQQIIAAYKGYWAALDVANTPPLNPDLPLLAHFATGPELAADQNKIRQHQAQGVGSRRPSPSVTQYRTKVISISGDRAQIQSCDIDDSYPFNIATGQVVDANGKPATAGVGTLAIHGTMVREGSTWKVWSLTLDQVTPGVSGCAQSS
jgi:hypothetical protein